MASEWWPAIIRSPELVVTQEAFASIPLSPWRTLGTVPDSRQKRRWRELGTVPNTRHEVRAGSDSTDMQLLDKG
ncbi:hypothetical protein GCM10009529_28200 [Micropruina glycogenica]